MLAMYGSLLSLGICLTVVSLTNTKAPLVVDVQIKYGVTVSGDDATSTARCPAGYIVTKCSCSIPQCDGVMLHGTYCTAHASYLPHTAVKAVATCTRYRSRSVATFTVRVPATGYGGAGRHSFTCPPDHTLLACSTHTFWYRRATSGVGDVSGNTCSFDCQTTGSQGCVIYSKCIQEFRGDYLSEVEEVKIVIGPASLALDDAKSKAQCPSGFQLLGCRCSVSNCDGAIPYDTYCVASASYHRTPVQAIATCGKFAAGSLDVIRSRLPSSGYNGGRYLEHSCPADYQLASCNTHTPWYRQSTWGLGQYRYLGTNCYIDCQTTSSHSCAISSTCVRKIDSAFVYPDVPASIQPYSDTVKVEGPLSAARDDAQSSVRCPLGYLLTNCRCSIARCDGVKLNSDGSCTAFASYLREQVKAVATCTKFKANSVDITTATVGSDYKTSRIHRYQCPKGYSLLSCNTHTPWYRRGTWGLGDVSGGQCTFDCTVVNHGCGIWAKCITANNLNLFLAHDILAQAICAAKNSASSRTFAVRRSKQKSSSTCHGICQPSWATGTTHLSTECFSTLTVTDVLGSLQSESGLANSCTDANHDPDYCCCRVK